MTTAARTPRRTPMDARMLQRRREVRAAGARRRRRTIGGIVLAAAVVAGGVGITRSPLFAITGVRVEGVPPEAARIVKDTAQVATGQNLMTANLDDAVARTEALPWVAEASIRRDPPATVVIDVVEREAVAVLAGPDEAWLVDASGVVIAEAGDEALPRIRTSGASVPIPGLAVDDPAAHNALQLHAALPADLRAALLAFEAEGPRSVRVRVALDRLERVGEYRKGRTVWVHMGAAGGVRAQVKVLRGLLIQLRQTRQPVPSEIDVRVPSNPVVIP